MLVTEKPQVKKQVLNLDRIAQHPDENILNNLSLKYVNLTVNSGWRFLAYSSASRELQRGGDSRQLLWEIIKFVSPSVEELKIDTSSATLLSQFQNLRKLEFPTGDVGP